MLMLTDNICGDDACPVDIMFINEPLLAIGCWEKYIVIFIQFGDVKKNE